MTAERFALDTNVLVYTRDDLGPDRQARARLVLQRSVTCQRCVLSAQTVGELYAALRKLGLVPPPAANQAVRDMVALFLLAGVQPQNTARALGAVAAGGFSC
jgi:predicted nucleic acid-binding protein